MYRYHNSCTGDKAAAIGLLYSSPAELIRLLPGSLAYALTNESELVQILMA